MHVLAAVMTKEEIKQEDYEDSRRDNGSIDFSPATIGRWLTPFWFACILHHSGA